MSSNFSLADLARKAIERMQDEGVIRIAHSCITFNSFYNGFAEKLETKGRLWLFLNQRKIRAFAKLSSVRHASMVMVYVLEPNLDVRKTRSLEYVFQLIQTQENIKICFGKDAFDEISKDFALPNPIPSADFDGDN